MNWNAKIIAPFWATSSIATKSTTSDISSSSSSGSTNTSSSPFQLFPTSPVIYTNTNTNSVLWERQFHGSVLVENRTLYVFGGICKDQTNSKNKKPCNSFFKCDLDSGDCELLPTKISKSPKYIQVPELSHHSMLLVTNLFQKSYIYVLGGRNKDGVSENGIYRFEIYPASSSGSKFSEDTSIPTSGSSLKIQSWERIECSNFQARHSFGCVCVDSYLYIFGGESTSGKDTKYFNDLLVFDPDTMQIRAKIDYVSLIEKRSGLSLSLYGNRIILFGGGNDKMGMFNDMYSMDIDTMEWEKVSYKGSTLPAKRMYHSATVIANKLILFGGSFTTNHSDSSQNLLIYDLEKHTWESTFTIPSATMVHLQQRNKKRKSSENRYKFPVFIQNNDLDIPCFMGHNSVLCESKLIVFGGEQIHHNTADTLVQEQFEMDDVTNSWNSIQSTSQYVYTLETNFQGIVAPISIPRCTLSSDFKKLISLKKKSKKEYDSVKMPQGLVLYDTIEQPFVANGDLIISTQDDEFIYEFYCDMIFLKIRCPVLYKEILKCSQNDGKEYKTSCKFYRIDINEDVLNPLKLKRSQKSKNFSKEKIKYTNILEEFEKSSQFHQSLQPKCLQALLEYIYSDQQPNELDTLSEYELNQLNYVSYLLELHRLYIMCNLNLESSGNVKFSNNLQLAMTLPPSTFYTNMKEMWFIAKEFTKYKTSLFSSNEITLYDEKDDFIHASDMSISSGDNSHSIMSGTNSDTDDVKVLYNSTNFEEENIVESQQLTSPQFDTFFNNSHCDVVFQCDHCVFYGHKHVIMARSSRFKELIVSSSYNITSNGVTIVRVNDLSQNVFLILMEFIYTGNCAPILFEYALELLLATEVYEVKRLSLLCQQLLEKKIHVHNVCKIFAIADQYCIDHLRDCCKWFVVTHLSQIKRTISYRRDLDTKLREEIRHDRKELRKRETQLAEQLFQANIFSSGLSVSSSSSTSTTPTTPVSPSIGLSIFDQPQKGEKNKKKFSKSSSSKPFEKTAVNENILDVYKKKKKNKGKQVVKEDQIYIPKNAKGVDVKVIEKAIKDSSKGKKKEITLRQPTPSSVTNSSVVLDKLSGMDSLSAQSLYTNEEVLSSSLQSNTDSEIFDLERSQDEIKEMIALQKLQYH